MDTDGVIGRRVEQAPFDVLRISYFKDLCRRDRARAELLRKVLEKGANPNAVSPSRTPASISSIGNGRKPLAIQLLLERDVNVRGEFTGYDATAYVLSKVPTFAVNHIGAEYVRIFLDSGVSIYQRVRMHRYGSHHA